MYGNSLEGAFTFMLFLAAAVGAAIFAVLFWLVPLIWEWIKPWLHALTA